MLRLIFTSAIVFLSLISVTSLVFADESVEVRQTEVGDEFTHHLEVIPKTLDGKDLPNFGTVKVTIFDKETNSQISEYHLHPMFGAFYHYGVNIKVENKPLLLKFEYHPPTFVRDINTKDKWIEHFEDEVEFNPALDYSQGVTIGTKETTDMNITYMVFPAKNMYELFHVSASEHDENSDDNHEDEEEEMSDDSHQTSEDKDSVQKAIPFAGIFVLGGAIGGLITYAFINKAVNGESQKSNTD